jgi:hypothetical protein
MLVGTIVNLTLKLKTGKVITNTRKRIELDDRAISLGAEFECDIDSRRVRGRVTQVSTPLPNRDGLPGLTSNVSAEEI